MTVTDQSLSLESLLPATMVALFRIPGELDPLRNLSVGQIRLMRALLPGKKTATQLSQKLGMSPSALTQMCGRLISAGLIEKGAASGDRRVRELELTALGSQLMASRRTLRAQHAAAVLHRLPKSKADALIGLLEEIVALDKAHVDFTEVLI